MSECEGADEILTTCNSVARDALPSESTAHSPGEMMETGLAGAVGIGFVAWDFDSFDGTNLTITNECDVTIAGKVIGITHVDDTSRIKIDCTLFATLLGTSPQERQAFLSESEHSVKV